MNASIMSFDVDLHSDSTSNKNKYMLQIFIFIWVLFLRGWVSTLKSLFSQGCDIMFGSGRSFSVWGLKIETNCTIIQGVRKGTSFTPSFSNKILWPPYSCRIQLCRSCFFFLEIIFLKIQNGSAHTHTPTTTTTLEKINSKQLEKIYFLTGKD